MKENQGDIGLNVVKTEVLQKNNRNQPQSYRNTVSHLQYYDNIADLEIKEPPEDLHKLNPSSNIYPFCIVWSPIPLISNILPFIGHLSIGNSKGILYDFCNSHYVSVDIQVIGKPIIYYQLKIEPDEAIEWDKAIEKSATLFMKREFDLFGRNGGSFCANVMNTFTYQGVKTHTKKSLGQLVWKKGVYIKPIYKLQNYIVLIILLIALIILLIIFLV